jgi:hypothetical protein
VQATGRVWYGFIKLRSPWGKGLPDCPVEHTAGKKNKKAACDTGLWLQPRTTYRPCASAGYIITTLNFWVSEI